MATTAVSSNESLEVVGIGPVELTVEERGDGKPYLVLHGGAGPQSVTALRNCWLTGLTTVYSHRPIQASVAHPGLTS